MKNKTTGESASIHREISGRWSHFFIKKFVEIHNFLKTYCFNFGNRYLLFLEKTLEFFKKFAILIFKLGYYVA